MEFTRLEEYYVRGAYNDLNYINKCQGKLSFVSNIFKKMSPNSLILDIGCGEHIHSRNDCFTVGIDICLKSERNKKSINSNLLLSNIMYLPFRKGVFDIILLISILHHIPVEKRRINCIRKCLSLTLPKLSNILIVVWAKEQRQLIEFPSEDVLVPYNLEDIWRKGYSREIPFNKFNTKEQRIILNSLPIYVISTNKYFCCFKLINIINNNLYQSLILYEERIKKTFKYFIERLLNISREIGIKTVNIWKNRNLLFIPELEKFVIKLTESIFSEVFVQIGLLQTKVLKYRYYHVFQFRELENLFEKISLIDPYLKLLIEKSEYEQGNWCIYVNKI